MIQQSIFIEYTPKSNSILDESFLDLEFAFDFNDHYVPEPNFENFNESEQSLSFEPFPSDLNQNSNFPNHESNDFTETSNLPTHSNEQQQISKSKTIAKSKKTKNVCFNICQKTVKVMKTRTYDSKLSEISAEFGLTSDKVIQKVLKIKKDLTGPKALQMFVEAEDAVSKVFKKFMKWFLEEKYLRHAINEGTMEDLKGYLEFKNSVILNLLED